MDELKRFTRTNDPFSYALHIENVPPVLKDYLEHL